MGKVSEFISSAFEDLCMAESIGHETPEDEALAKPFLRNAFGALLNFAVGEKCKIDPKAEELIQQWDFDRYKNAIDILLEQTHAKEMYVEYWKDYFSL